MKIEISLQGTHDGVELRSLYRWLERGRRELAAHGTALAPPVAESEGHEYAMGAGAFDVIQLVVDAVPQWGALAVSITAWRAAHGSRSSITVERDGVKVTLPAADPDDLSMVLRALEGLEASADPEGGE
ncbi:effector-associated constant component EACC1 [Streptomyces odontomachi]|uniref:effector-associated constant component EACC1 n=1 Tax=Streptomyces odontomachi TaxID=2944940 RepID=UPI00210BD8E8|nr:hypothetical protein [Streptomyces sp. ODS25]